MLDDKSMQFIEEIYEARMTRNAYGQMELSYTDCCERLYLSVLILALLSQYSTYKHFAKSYAKETTAHSSYKRFRMSSTDLYNFIYFVTGDEKAINKLKDPKSAMILRNRTSIPTMALNRYLSKLATSSRATDMQLLVNLETGLKIRNADYKAIRRDITNYGRLSERARKKAVTKLLFAARAKLRNSDIIEHLERLAIDKDLETGLIRDREPKISTPDIGGLTGRDLAMYRYLTGTKNIQALKRFVDFALAGRPIPSTFVQAYLPAIKMIDDIVKGGPALVGVLKTLQKRAQKVRRT